MFLSFSRARINVLTKETFKSKLLFFLQFDSFWLKHTIFFILSGNHVLRVVDVCFPIEIMHISRSSKSSTILFCVFGGFASSLSWHLANRASGKLDLRPP